MERQREKSTESVSSEVAEKPERELEELRRELARLKELKKQRELQKLQDEEITEQEKSKEAKAEEIEARLDRIEDFLTSKLGIIDQKEYEKNAQAIEEELEKIELEIVGEEGVAAKEVSTYELLLNDYPWLEEKRYVFMFSIPNKKTNLKDYESWKNEWSKVLFDYARYAILHILYLRKLHTIKPFSNFENRDQALQILAQELVDRTQAEWLSKSKEKLRVYWKSLDNWAEEIYQWALEISPLEPILIFEIRESNKEFSTLPNEDIERIFKLLEKDKRGKIIKLEDGQVSFKIKVE
jgi:DNA repair exonuclease SbcCD ATPase subunit